MSAAGWKKTTQGSVILQMMMVGYPLQNSYIMMLKTRVQQAFFMGKNGDEYDKPNGLWA